MAGLIIKNASVVLPDRILSGHSVAVSNGKIISVLANADARNSQQQRTFDAAGCYLAPGFIDLHIHGLHN